MSTTDPKKNDEFQPGPFEDTTTKTIVVKPIEITITHSRKSTHVPPPEPGCMCGGGGGLDLASALPVIMQAVRSAASDPGDGGGFPGEGNPE